MTGMPAPVKVQRTPDNAAGNVVVIVVPTPLPLFLALAMDSQFPIPSYSSYTHTIL